MTKLRNDGLQSVKTADLVNWQNHIARTTALTETLTLTITVTLTLFSHSVIHRQHFTGGRNHWVKRLVREVAGSNLNGTYFVIQGGPKKYKPLPNDQTIVLNRIEACQ